ncbi:nicotinamide riboside transporter PnuC [Gilvimarinus sp. SDUM040013]|uniref:Nicotinamide riboside transporter PnuC n=1 Tax=Gilvimarinus gilvus TaxID=3058038 RepID=A0ABU4S1S1_9GAMM|nr:nicotinamide riboside transporter PnuC [Gilvimarinus sp. SDUM040013]MDO3388062.1 nicotinamide riboside transporter PnuC [Gilvimarinus sp. SDUM040013]MDX6850970.1 nicotinamide riboside transporter PnuC [Gilvimarinus sp. SDUM040013]
MSSVSEQVQTALATMSGWEFVAVTLAIAYLLLAVRQNSLCWYCAFASTAIYTVLFWDVQLLMESALNVYYMLMAVYGWWQWRHGGKADTKLPVRRWQVQQHIFTIAGIVTITLLSGTLLHLYTEAAWPYLDSFTTWASVITTYMVARKILENWLYWMVINSTSIFLFIDRGLYLTALLLVSYLIISIFGLMNWRRDYRQHLTAHA